MIDEGVLMSGSILRNQEKFIKLI